MDRDRNDRPFDRDGLHEELDEGAPQPRLSAGKRSPSSQLIGAGPPPVGAQTVPTVFRSARGGGAPARAADRVMGVSVAGGDRLPAELLGRLGAALGQDM